jgi:hypothetical protein
MLRMLHDFQMLEKISAWNEIPNLIQQKKEKKRKTKTNDELFVD